MLPLERHIIIRYNTMDALVCPFSKRSIPASLGSLDMRIVADIDGDAGRLVIGLDGQLQSRMMVR